MAMPRYKYAIGNAPVRFPSLPSQTNIGSDQGVNPQTTDDVSSNSQESGETVAQARPSRWSMFFGGSAETVDKNSIKKTRSQQDLRGSGIVLGNDDERLGPDMQRSGSSTSSIDRQRSKSMYAATSTLAPNTNTIDPAKRQPQPRQFRSSLYSSRNEGESRTSKRVSWVMPSPVESSSRSSSRANSIREGKVATEQTSLLRGNTSEMAQREQSQKPLSTSLRPSSLFWTTDNERNASEQSNSAIDAKRTNLSSVSQQSTIGRSASPNLKASYGSTDNPATTSESPDEDDPYGYRAMAGPTLLPIFHERQKIKQTINSRANSTILSVPAACSTSRWLSLIGLSIIAAGLFFFLVV